MDHDFGSGGTSDKRVSSKGEACTGVGGYMDYNDNHDGNGPNKWSPCSVEDLTNYYTSVNPWCLTQCKFDLSNLKDYHRIHNNRV